MGGLIEKRVQGGKVEISIKNIMELSLRYFSWQSIPHFFSWPLSGIEYGIAQLGAVQVWQNALENQTDALARYREALSLGCTIPLPELLDVAGSKLAFDADTLHQAVTFMAQTIADLSKITG